MSLLLPLAFILLLALALESRQRRSARPLAWGPSVASPDDRDQARLADDLRWAAASDGGATSPDAAVRPAHLTRHQTRQTTARCMPTVVS